jgi:hypothetical protein
MALSTTTWTITAPDVGKVQWDLTFEGYVTNAPGYLEKSHVSLWINDVQVTEGGGAAEYDGSGITFSWITSTLVQTSGYAGVLNDKVEFRRTVPKNKPYIDFVDRAGITESKLDQVSLANLYCIHEIMDGFGTGIFSYYALAKAYAEYGEDVEVETGTYSAKHYSIKTAANAAAAAADAVDTAADAVSTAADVVSTNADAAATAADVVSTNADAASTAADAIATAADRVQTGLDVLATAADVLSIAGSEAATAADAAATAADVIATNADAASTADDAALCAQAAIDTAADVVSTGEDAAATAADRVQTGLDAVATAADRVQTGLDAAAAAADVIAIAGATDATAADAEDTAADRVQTGLDAAATAADRVQTGLDAAATAADVATTGEDAVSTAADVILAAKWASEDEDVEVEAGLYSALHWAAKASAIAEGAGGLPSGTIQLFGNNSAPTGWTRKSDWTNNSMFTYRATGDLVTGGSVDAKAQHVHTGPSHVHTGPNHRHTGPSHTHGVGSLYVPAHNHVWYNFISGSNDQSYNSAGTGITITTNNNDESGILATSGFADGVEKGIGVDLYTSNKANTSIVGTTAAGGTGYTGYQGTGNTGAGGTGNTGSNSAPYYQELIAAEKD